MAQPLAPNAFIGKSKKPTERELASALGSSKKLWENLVAELKRVFGLKEEWKSYSTKAGWSMRLKHKQRNVVYFGPLSGSFRVTFVLGDKAVKAALASGLPARIIMLIKTATRYPEGTAVRMEIKNRQDAAVVIKLAGIKLEN